MNIYDIKKAVSDTSPKFFSRENLKFFNQTMRDFEVTKRPDGRYDVTSKRRFGITKRIFNPASNRLETV